MFAKKGFKILLQRNFSFIAKRYEEGFLNPNIWDKRKGIIGFEKSNYKGNIKATKQNFIKCLQRLFWDTLTELSFYVLSVLGVLSVLDP